ncbi:MAG: glycosyltransferase family 2 protein [Clostridia bacterium]|nr:glycosyltransferase family 2 protein [Clostridia bacterium]
MKELTIFTPVYNRANLIRRLYDSLMRQTNKEFVWQIVDDGSTDNIKQVIDAFKSEADFDIRYFYQENAGKHVAHNTGVELCDTLLFCCVDSDDYLVDNAVDIIYEVHKKNEQCDYLGYYFRKIDTEGNISGGDFHLENNAVGLRELYFKYSFVGELTIVLKTQMIREYEFPVFDNERFVSEKVLYNQLDCIAPMLFIDEPIYIFEYQQSGYTKNSIRLLSNNPKGGAMGYISDAAYGKVFIERAKAYSSFLAMKHIYKLRDKFQIGLKIPLSVKLLGYLFLPHYRKLFRNIKRCYGLEEK